ncbi:MAG: TIGR00730 family Rossman fold protein [Pseudomonadota bacterium]
MNRGICVFCGARSGNLPGMTTQIETLVSHLIKHDLGLIYGGGSAGLMGEAADAMLRQGGEVTGIIPRFLVNKEVLHSGITHSIEIPDLFERKAKMLELSDGFICLPGGMGTFDELFEILTWRQLGQTTKPIAILNYQDYFSPFFELLQHAADAGFYDMRYFEEVVICHDSEQLANLFLSKISEL